MSVLSSSERVLVDTLPHKTKLYLSLYQPNVALSCQINGTYDVDNQTVDYDNVTEGSYLNIDDYNYLVALIGTSPGLEDVGRTWVRSATSSSLRFVESDHIDWANDLYVTVLEYTEIIPVFPRIIQNPSDPEDVIFYKVWDVAYTNQNSILGTFINMGSNYAGFLDGGVGTCFWSASGTSNLLGENLTYNWSFEGATTTGSTSHTPGNISWNQPGHYRVILDVTSTSGRVDRSIRYVSWYDRPDEGTVNPILKFEFSDLSGSRDGVGYTGRIKVRNFVPTSSIIPGTIAVIFKEDWYGNTKQSLKKSDLGRDTIFFAGYVNSETLQYDYFTRVLEFEILSPTNLMEITECFAVSVEHSATPSTWWQLLDLDIQRALYHYYAWHSSVLLCCDFSIDSIGTRAIQYFDADRTSLYDAGNSLTDGSVRSRLLSNSLGHLWVEQDVSVKDNANSTIPVSMSITKDDWIGTPNITIERKQNVSFIELGGISFDQVTGESVPLVSTAPGAAPAYSGKPERKQGMALVDQDELNTIAGNLYAYRNSTYPKSDLTLRGNFANLDIAPQEQILWTVDTNDTPRQVSFSNKSFAIRDVSWSWDAANEVLYPKISVSEITQGFPGTTYPIPVVPPDEVIGGGGGTVALPPIQIPQIPPVVGSTGILGINVYENGVYKGTSADFNFVGSILQVVMTWITGSSGQVPSGTVNNVMANIIFDACGCSGTFAFL